MISNICAQNIFFSPWFFENFAKQINISKLINIIRVEYYNPMSLIYKLSLCL